MGWQLMMVWAIVAAAVVYLMRQTWRSWAFGKSTCAGSCGCSNSKYSPHEEPESTTLIPADQLTIRHSPR
jgi:hypothetical protein